MCEDTSATWLPINLFRTHPNQFITNSTNIILNLIGKLRKTNSALTVKCQSIAAVFAFSFHQKVCCVSKFLSCQSMNEETQINKALQKSVSYKTLSTHCHHNSNIRRSVLKFIYCTDKQYILACVALDKHDSLQKLNWTRDKFHTQKQTS